MTVSSSINKVVHLGNGSSTLFPFAFKVFDEAHLQVILTDADGIETALSSGYTVSLNGNQDANPGGTVTCSPAIVTGTKLTVLRLVPYTQETDIKNQGGYYPEVLERRLDLTVMQVQQLAEQSARSVKVDVSSSTNPDDMLDEIQADIAAANAAAVAAAGSEADAEAAQVAAEAAQAVAEAAQGAAEAAAATVSGLLQAVSHITASPYTPVLGDGGKLIAVDTSGGDVTINLPAIASLGGDWRVGISKRSADAGHVIIACAGGNTIAGQTIWVLANPGQMTILVAQSGTTDWQPSDAYQGSGVGEIAMPAIAVLRSGPLRPQNFGAVGGGTVDDATPLKNWFTEIVNTGREGRLDAVHKSGSQLDWDLQPARTTGVKIIGAGPQRGRIIFSSGVPAPNLKIWIGSGSPRDAFYSTFRDFGVYGTVDGAMMQVGDGDNDAHNSYAFDGLVLNNASTGGNNVVLDLQSVYNSFFRVIVNGYNTGSGKAAIKLQKVQFSSFFGAVGHSAIGTWLTNGYSFGNTFQAIDHEVLTRAIVIDSVNANRNEWLSGQFGNVDYIVKATAGSGNRIVNANLSPSVSRIDGSNYVGVIFSAPGQNFPATPSMPSSGVGVKNASGQTTFVYITGGTTSNIKVNGAQVGATTPATILLLPEDTIAITYSGMPGWIWRGFYA